MAAATDPVSVTVTGTASPAAATPAPVFVTAVNRSAASPSSDVAAVIVTS